MEAVELTVRWAAVAQREGWKQEDCWSERVACASGANKGGHCFRYFPTFLSVTIVIQNEYVNKQTGQTNPKLQDLQNS